MRRRQPPVPTHKLPRGDRRGMEFVMRLARALHVYGSPAHILEGALERIAQRLGIEAQFFATPTSVYAAFGSGPEQRLVLERLEPGRVNLEKLSLLDELLDGVLAGRVPIAELSSRLRRIVERPRRYGGLVTALGYAAASGSAARFFGGGWGEMAVATGVGLVLGLLANLSERSASLGRLYEPLAAALAAALAAVAAVLTGSLSAFVVMLAGLIVLIPGLTLTVAMRELATGNLVAGSSRLAGTVVVFVTIAFGVALGRRAMELLLGPLPEVPPVVLPWGADLFALAVSAWGLMVLFRARPRDYVWIFLAGALALYSGREGVRLLGPELGALQAALAVGLASNLFARFLRRPAAVTQVPGLMLLVPGSVGFRSLAMLLEEDTVIGVQTAFSMLLVATALVTGLLLANALLPPKRTL